MNPAPVSSGERMLLFVFGTTGAGKSQLINTLTGSDLEVGDSLESCTADIQVGTPIRYKGREVLILDTPGFNDSHMSDVDILKNIATCLEASYAMGQGRASGIIFVHNINDVKVTGSGHKNLQMFQKLVGGDTLKNVVFLTNRWPSPPSQIQLAREAALKRGEKYFGAAIQRGARTFRGKENAQQSDLIELIDMFLPCEPAAFEIQKELVDRGLNLASTAAGQVLSKEMEELHRRYQDEIQEIQKAMEEARAQDMVRFRELEEDKKREERRFEDLQQKEAELRSDLQKEKDDLLRIFQSNAQPAQSTRSKAMRRTVIGVKVIGAVASLALMFLGLPVGLPFIGG